MTGILLKREVFVSRLPLPESGASSRGGIRPTDSWMGIYFTDGTKIGYTHSTVIPRPEGFGGGYTARNISLIKMSLLGQPVELRAKVNWTLDKDGKVEDLKFELDSSEYPFSAEGKVENGTLRLKVSTGESEFTKDLPIGDNLLVSDTLNPVMTLPDIKEGGEYAVEVLDPVALTTRRVKLKAASMEKVKIGPDTVDARRIEVDFEGFATTVWVAGDGEVVKVETPIGLIMVKEPPEEAIRGGATGTEVPDIVSAVAIPSGKTIERPDEARRIVVRFQGVEPDRFDVWGDYQRIVAPKSLLVEVSRSDVQAENAPKLPVSGSDLDEFVKPSPFIQSDDSRITTMAREIVGTETNSWRAALKLLRWVHENIKKETVASVPSAVDVLQMRKGDCNEHTVLYVALARAVGLPARTAVGLVYKDGFFYYHAWPEVHVGRWVPIDPTFGQEVADPTHIKLSEGELYRWTDILPTIKKLKLDVVRVDYGAK